MKRIVEKIVFYFLYVYTFPAQYGAKLCHVTACSTESSSSMIYTKLKNKCLNIRRRRSSILSNSAASRTSPTSESGPPSEMNRNSEAYTTNPDIFISASNTPCQDSPFSTPFHTCTSSPNDSPEGTVDEPYSGISPTRNTSLTMTTRPDNDAVSGWTDQLSSSPDPPHDSSQDISSQTFTERVYDIEVILTSDDVCDINSNKGYNDY